MIGLILLVARLISLELVSPPYTPVEVGRTANAALVVVHRQPGVPIVALRLSILTPDPAGYAGAGHMIQHVLYPSLEDRVRRVGGTVQIQRTSDAIVYTVTGPADELTYLSDVLISTLNPPTAPLDVILRAERELREERLAEWETASAHTRSLLRAQVFPADISATGTDRSSTRFSASTLPGIWADMYDPARVAVVAVGDVYLGDIQHAFERIPPAYEPRRLGIERDTVILTSLTPPQATRAWLGNAYLASDLPPAAVTVTARLLGDLLRARLPSAEVQYEHWWTHYGQAIALVVAVPGEQMAAAQRALDTAVSTLLGDVGFLDVLDAATAIRREMLFYSRTPDRMAEVIGLFVDREGDPNATERFYAELAQLDDDDVREVLVAIRERTPARAEVPPQALQRRQ